MNVDFFEVHNGSLCILFTESGHGYDWGFLTRFGEYLRLADGDEVTVYTDPDEAGEFYPMTFNSEPAYIEGTGFGRVPEVPEFAKWSGFYQRKLPASLKRKVME